MATVTSNKLSFLVNPALWELGDDGLSSLSKTSANIKEKMCANTIDDIVIEVLNEVDWICVSKRDTSLTSNSNIVKDEFLYGYDLPSDFIHLIGTPLYYGPYGIPMNPDNLTNLRKQWRIVGSILETDLLNPDILYVYKTSFDDEDSDEDTYYTLFDSSLKRSVQTLAKARWADAVAGKDPVKYEQLYRQIIKEAQSKNDRNRAYKRIGNTATRNARLRGR